MKIADELKAGVKLAIMLPVIALISIPMIAVVLVSKLFDKTTPQDYAAVVLRKCIDGAADADDEVDSFTSMNISDPRLKEIQTELSALCGPGWESLETRRKLCELLKRVQAMPTAEPS